MMEEKEKIVIKMVDESRDSGDWRQVALKNRRSLSSVITEGGLKEMLERDINQFCKAERWYSSRGVPWRRGYLLHGMWLREPNVPKLSFMFFKVFLEAARPP